MMSEDESLLHELRMSERMLREDGDIVRRFRVMTGEGTFVLFAPVEATTRRRRQSKQLIRGFMLWHMARWFVVSMRLDKREAIASFLVTRKRQVGVMRQIGSGSNALGAREWLPAAALDSTIADLLPKKSALMSAAMYRMMVNGTGLGLIEIAGPF